MKFSSYPQYDLKNELLERDYLSHNSHYEGYTQQELDDMYMAAFEGDPSAQWNID